MHIHTSFNNIPIRNNIEIIEYQIFVAGCVSSRSEVIDKKKRKIQRKLNIKKKLTCYPENPMESECGRYENKEISLINCKWIDC